MTTGWQGGGSACRPARFHANLALVKLICPRCQQPLPLDDVNVARDVALCRRCQQTFSFAEVALDCDLRAVDLARPPPGAWFRTEGRDFEVGATTRSGAAFFLVPFTLFWSGGSMAGIYGTQFWKGHFDWKLSLFGLPFLLGTCILVPACLMAIAGRVVVRGRNEQGEIFTGVGPIGWRRRFRWGDVTAVGFGTARWQRNYRPVRQILLETPRQKLKFASGLKEERQNFLLAALRRQLGPR